MPAIRAISRGSYQIYFLATLYALQSFFFYANWWSFGLNYPAPFLVLLGIILSPITGVFFLYSMGMIYYLAGRLLKGKASFACIRACWASSKGPCLISLLLWGIFIFISPKEVFIQDSQKGPSSLLINSISLLIGLWSIALLIKKIRPVQGFSLSRALCSVLLAWIFFAILVFLVLVLFAINSLFAF